MKSAIICEQWKFEYSAPPSRRGRGLPTTPGRVKTSPRQRQPCPRAGFNPAPGLEPRCPAGLIGLTDHRSADRYRHPSRQSRAPFHHFTMYPITLTLQFRHFESFFTLKLSQRKGFFNEISSLATKLFFYLLSQKCWQQLSGNQGSCSFSIGIIAGWQRLQPSISGSDYHRII